MAKLSLNGDGEWGARELYFPHKWAQLIPSVCSEGPDISHIETQLTQSCTIKRKVQHARHGSASEWDNGCNVRDALSHMVPISMWACVYMCICIYTHVCVPVCIWRTLLLCIRLCSDVTLNPCHLSSEIWCFAQWWQTLLFESLCHQSVFVSPPVFELLTVTQSCGERITQFLSPSGSHW